MEEANVGLFHDTEALRRDGERADHPADRHDRHRVAGSGADGQEQEPQGEPPQEPWRGPKDYTLSLDTYIHVRYYLGALRTLARILAAHR